MSGRGKGKSGGRPSSRAGSTVNSSVTSTNVSYTSPLGVSRFEEKERLGGLNNRLAAYIERVRELELENRRLDVKIKEIEVLENREKDNMREAYEKEIADLRRSLDAVANEKAKARVEADRYAVENQEISARLRHAEKVAAESEERAAGEAALARAANDRCAKAEDSASRTHNECKRLKAELADASNKAALAQKQLEEETLMRIDAENRKQSMKEELEFLKQRHSQEMSEVKEKRETEVELRSRDIASEYESQLRAQLDDSRHLLAAQLDDQRRMLENKFNAKLEAADARVHTCEEEMRNMRGEHSAWRTRIDGLDREKQQLQAQIDALQRERDQAQSALRTLRADYEARLEARDNDILRLRDMLAQMEREYTELMSTKVQLDQELDHYRALLEDEENRLNIASPRAQPGGKRRRIDETTADDETVQQHAMRRVRGVRLWDRSTQRDKVTEYVDQNIGIMIAEHTGDSVKLQNTTNRDLGLQGFKLRQTSENGEVEYKFNSRHAIPDNEFLLIWSKDAASAPGRSTQTQIKMKQFNWSAPTDNCDTVRTALLNENGDEVAWRQTIREAAITSGLEAADAEGQRCAIM